MGNYNGSETYTPLIYIFEDIDLVLGGLSGVSNLPIKQLADNSSYLKKFTGSFLHGTGDPSPSTLTGMTLDVNSINNILYMDDVTGSIYKLTSISPITWVNTYKTAILNVKGLSINNNGNTSDVLTFTYNDSDKTLELKDESNNFGDLKVGKIYFDTLESEQLNFSKVADNEIILLYEITDQSENNDAMFSVKRLEDVPQITLTSYEVGTTTDRWNFTLSSGVIGDYFTTNDFVQIKGFTEQTGEIINGFYKINSLSSNYFTTLRAFKGIISDFPIAGTGETGTVSKDVSAMVRWNNTAQYFEFVTRQGDLLPINCSGFFINDVASGFIATRVISSTLQFDQLFNYTQTGSDICYFKKPETNYVDIIEQEYIYLKKNGDEVDGHYELFNYVEFLGSNIKIECAPGVNIKYMNSTCGFRIQDDTELIVNNYSGSTFNVLSEKTQYINGDNISDQHIMLQNDRLFSFSDNGEVNKKYSINSIVKNSDNDLSNISSLSGTDDFDAKEYNDYLYYAYIDAGDSSKIKLKKYTWNPTSKNFDLTDNMFTSTDTNMENVSIFLDIVNSYVYIIANNATDIRYYRVAFSGSGGATQVLDTNSYKNPKLFVDGSNIFVLAYKSGDLKLFKTPYVPSVTTHQVTTDVLTNSVLQAYDLTIYGTTIIVTYCYPSLLKIYKIGTDFVTGEQTITASGTDQGYSSKLLLTGNVDEPIYVAYTKDSASMGTYEDMIYFGKISLGTFAITNQTEVFASTEYMFKSFDFVKNSNNKYPTSSTSLFHIFAANKSLVAGTTRWLSSTSTNNGTSWASNEIDLIVTTSDSVRLVRTENNIYTIVNSDTISSTTDSITLKYNYLIDVFETITGGITDFILSTNYKNNIELKLEIDVNNYNPNKIICTGNSIDSDYNIKIINSYSSIGIEGNKKTFNDHYVVNIDNSNFMDSNLDSINHSNIINSSLTKSINTGSLNFNDCININVIGIIDGTSIVGNGTFDE